MKLSDLLFEGEYECLSSPDVMDLCVTGICSSSMDVLKGYAFVCLRGVHTDGTLYITDACLRGASVCIYDKVPAVIMGKYVVVKNARLCLSMMLSRFWQESSKNMDIYAITGTNGKTSTALFLREIFMMAGYVTGYIGTLKSYVDRERLYLGEHDDDKMSTMTTPDPEQLYKMIHLMRCRGVQKLIIEASSHALKLDKLAPLHFISSAFINFASDHLDFHLSTGDYLLSKCKIFSMSDNVIINADDPVCIAAMKAFKTPAYTYGIHEHADCMAKNINSSLSDGVSYDLCHKGKIARVSSSLFGEFTVYNSLAAATIALSQGIDEQTVAKGIGTLECVEGRLERIELPDGYSDISVFIDYAHTENAMEKLLGSVSEFRKSGQRIVTLFGCGGDRDKEKRAPMGMVASLYSDLVIITEDNSRSEDIDAIIDDIMHGIDTKKEYIIIKNRKNAIQFAIENAKHGDIILLVGKGHEQYEITKEGKIPFSEKDIVYETLARRKKGVSK